MKTHSASWRWPLLSSFVLVWVLAGCGPELEPGLEPEREPRGTMEQAVSPWPDFVVSSITRSASGYSASICNAVDSGGYGAQIQVKWYVSFYQQPTTTYSMGFYGISCVTVTTSGGCAGFGNGTCTDALTMTVTVDSNYQIAEMSEDNNSRTQTFTVADTTPPSASVTSPAAGATVSGSVAFSASASDNIGVSRVDFYVGGTLLGSDTTSPYGLTWNTGSHANGAYSLTARAFDAAGNNTTSAPVSVTVANAPDTTPPTVTITAPASGSTVSEGVTFSATASDNVAVTRVDFYAGATLIGSDTTAPYSVTWNTGANGTYTLTAQALDAASNSASASVTVTVSNLPIASFDATLRAPLCSAVGPGCTSGSGVNGRASLGPESNAPNTLANSCADGTSGSYHVDESVDVVRVFTSDGSNLRAGVTANVSVTVWAYYSFSSDRLDIYHAPSASSPSWTLLATLSPTGAGKQTLGTTVALPAGSLQAIRAQFRYGGTASPCTSGSYNDRDDLVFAVAP